MALKIQKFEGMASDYSTSMLENFYVVESPGWKATRASGVLAVLLAAYPDMPYEAIAAFAHANGLPDWEFNVDQGDSTLLARDGVIYFLEDYPLPSNWSALFKDWAANYEISELPREYVQPAAPAAPIEPPPPQPQYTDFDEDAFYEEQYYNQPSSPSASPSQPQPVPASYNQPTPSSTSQTSAPQPPAQNAAYVVQPTTQAKTDVPWVWIIGGAAALLFLMKGKKKKR